jgi:uncharacterized protein
MNGDNKQLIRRVYDAFQSGNVDGILQNLTDDFDWNAPGSAPFSGFRHGRDQMREFFTEVRRLVRFDQFDIDDIVAEGDKLVVIGRQRATVLETGRHFETPFAHIFKVRGDKLASGLALSDTEAAAACFGESRRERQALTGSLGITHPAFSGRGTPE